MVPSTPTAPLRTASSASVAMPLVDWTMSEPISVRSTIP
jgi:hypothetical protein